jgi:hypothetical protein
MAFLDFFCWMTPTTERNPTYGIPVDESTTAL